jgi:hypothetical protein
MKMATFSCLGVHILFVFVILDFLGAQIRDGQDFDFFSLGVEYRCVQDHNSKSKHINLGLNAGTNGREY